MALAKVLHFFCNTRFQDKLLVEIDTFLANKVREFFFLIKVNYQRQDLSFTFTWRLLESIFFKFNNGNIIIMCANMLKVNNKDARMASKMLFCCLYY